MQVAQRINVVVVDDLDGSEADETVTFGLDGTTYEIDLSTSNATNLRAALSTYIGVARVKRAKRSASAPAGSSTSRRRGTKSKEVREWAEAHGIEVSGTGRIPKEIVQQYEEAQAS